MTSTDIVADIRMNGVLNNSYVVLNVIEKHYKEVFVCKDIRTDEEVVIKVEEVGAYRRSRLELEYQFYERLSGGNGFTRPIDYFVSVNHRVLVMKKLGNNLQQIHERSVRSGHRLPMQTIAEYADQMVSRVANCHLRNVIHRDIKPENFVVDADEGKYLYLIDFNLAHTYSEKYKHFPFATQSPDCSVGNIVFLSANAHNGFVQTRRDDMLSIGYSLIYLAKGKLPWSGIRSAKTRRDRMQAIADIKLKVSAKELCSGLPKQFAIYMKYCAELGFYDRPDYIYLRQLFRQILIEAQESGAESDLVNDNSHDDWIES